VEQVVMPDSMVRQAQQPTGRTLEKMPNAAQPTPNSSRPSGLIHPPLPLQIRPETKSDRDGGASAVPSLLPKAIQNIKDSPTRSDLHRSKIKLPEGSKVQWASATEDLSNQGRSDVRQANATHDLTPVPSDTKVAEIGFHPRLCRGHNFDSEPGDDGLYLVVCPTNAAGEVLNELGTMTVVVEEEAADSSSATRIAIWEFTQSQLTEMLTPIGASQGFHLSLPWQEIQPSSSQVVVYVRYSLENGRTLVNRRSVQLRKPKAGRSVWTPR
jgi:hypothetical protein